METKSCQNCKNDFNIEKEDFTFYEKIKMPSPTFCPECRMIRRMLWRNERSLYHRTCEATGKKIISCFSPKSGITVYERDYWWSDAWDPLNFGLDYDFSKPFFEQFEDLLHTAPFPNLFNGRSVNSNYSNHVGEMKNSYLSYAAWYSEDIFYSAKAGNVKESMDCLSITHSDLCYQCTSVRQSSRLFFSKNCENCLDSWFLYDCTGCNNCFGCANLRNKSYCIFNEQFSREEYIEKIKSFDLGSHESLEAMKEKIRTFWKNSLHRYAYFKQAVDSTGNNLFETKNCKYCFDAFDDVADSKYCINAVGKMTDTYDGYGPGLGELMYEIVDSGDRAQNLFFTIVTWNCVRSYYCYNCHGCADVFGCIGLRNKKYCILNKQYTKEEYEELLPKIKEHMKEMPYIDKDNRKFVFGDFFPYDLSPFSYNETIAHEYFPESKEKVLALGFKWALSEENNYKASINAEDLPDKLPDNDEEILNAIIGCINKGDSERKCTSAFRVTMEELKFYKRFSLPLPRFCPNCRYYERMQLSNPPKLWHRSCMCDKPNHFHGDKHCEVEFETSYAPERPETIYCEKCYQQEVY